MNNLSKLLSLGMALLVSLATQALTITDSGAWLETAYVKWEAVQDAESYSVYVSGMGLSNHKLDNLLIRNYGSYYRADALGLKAGDYSLKVAALVAGVEVEVAQTQTLQVMAYDRSGFAFSNGRQPGAYNADGTPKSNAVTIYITENTKNTISMDVTGANANPCVGFQAILDGFKKGKDNRPLIVRLVGQITDPATMWSGDVVIENANNTNGHITIEGVGDDAVADGWGIRIKNASNIEIRNIGLMNCDSDEGDNIGLQQNNEYIWVHHCDFFYGAAGGDADQAKGDGALDCKKSTYVTFDYNHFWDTGKSNLLGLGEGTTDGLFVTYHHNWYDHSDSRHPRVRYYSAHVYNNYYDGNSKYGVGSTLGSSVFVEGNYFRNCKYPMLISMQGSDVFNESTGQNDYANMPTFSKENGGIVKACNNYLEGQRRFVAYGDVAYANSTVDFDAYVVTDRNETVPASVVSAYGGTAYNNFDTNASVMYGYTADDPETARQKVMAFAGRMSGGDFTWVFNNAVDDAFSDVNSGLKAALSNYETLLVSIQGDGEPQDGGDGGGGDNGGGNPVEGDEVHNFTESGLNSTFYSISGNLSTSKGTVSYNGLTLTQCLKIESATSINFTTTKSSTLTLVFNSDFSGGIKIDGISQAVINGLLTASLDAGSHSITKDNTCNLYYMSTVYDTSTAIEPATASAFNIYPNPVSQLLFVEGNEEVKALSMYDMAGRQVLATSGVVKTVDVGHLPKGAYFVKITSQSGTHLQKIVKQ